MKKLLYVFGSFAGIGLFLRVFTSAIEKKDAEPDWHNGQSYHVFACDIPKNLGFAGEKLPVENFDVRERIDRELLVNTFWQSQTLLFYKRANRWFPVIEPILKQYGIPDDFKYLALIESGLINTVSPSGAVGYWQFLDNTAKNYGLEINEDVDERYHIEKSTEAACKYFKEAKEELGNWTLAAGSYNMGIGGMKKQVEKQRVNSYYDLMLNDETSRYVFRIIAVKELILHPLAYGYHLRKKDLYPQVPSYVVTVDSTIKNIVDFAAKYNTSYKFIKLLNPWLRQNTLLNKTHKTYTVKIPKPGFNEMMLQEIMTGVDSTEAVKPIIR